jgi:hypothetical protein
MSVSILTITPVSACFFLCFLDINSSLGNLDFCFFCSLSFFSFLLFSLSPSYPRAYDPRCGHAAGAADLYIRPASGVESAPHVLGRRAREPRGVFNSFFIYFFYFILFFGGRGFCLNILFFFKLFFFEDTQSVQVWWLSRSPCLLLHWLTSFHELSFPFFLSLSLADTQPRRRQQA